MLMPAAPSHSETPGCCCCRAQTIEPFPIDQRKLGEMDPNHAHFVTLDSKQTTFREQSIGFDNDILKYEETTSSPLKSFRLQHDFLDNVYNSHPDLEDISAKLLDQISQQVGLSMKEILLWFQDENLRRARLETSLQTHRSFHSFSRSPQSVADSERNSTSTITIESSSVSSTEDFSQLRDLASCFSPTPIPSTLQATPAPRRRGRPPKNEYASSNTRLVSSPNCKRQKFSPIYPCVDCKRTFPAERWPEHVRRVHFPDFVWECPKQNCHASSKPFFRPDNFATHLRGEHDCLPSEISQLKETCRFEVVDFYHKTCGICDETLSSRDESIDHIKDHFRSISQRTDPPADLGISEWREKCGYEHVLRRGVHYRLDIGSTKQEDSQDDQYEDGGFDRGNFSGGFSGGWANQQGSHAPGDGGNGSSNDTSYHSSQGFEFMDFGQYSCNEENDSAVKETTEVMDHEVSNTSSTASPDTRGAENGPKSNTDPVLNDTKKRWRQIEPLVVGHEYSPLLSSLIPSGIIGLDDDIAGKKPKWPMIPELSFNDFPLTQRHYGFVSDFVDPAILYPEDGGSEKHWNGPVSGSQFPSQYVLSSVDMGLSHGSPDYHSSTPRSPYPYLSPPRRPPLSSTRTSSTGMSFLSDESREKGRCSYPGCHRVFKDLKAHMLTHQVERPEKCPVETCDYHTKGFARTYDKNRHTLTHYKGTLTCGFCPGSGTVAEKSFNRADVFKRHLVAVHSVELTPPNSRKTSAASVNVKSRGPGTTGICSTCSVAFGNAQQFYEHLDSCVLKTMQLENASSETNPSHSAEIGDGSVAEDIRKDELNTGQEAFIDDRDRTLGKDEERHRHQDETSDGAVTRSKSGLRHSKHSKEEPNLVPRSMCAWSVLKRARRVHDEAGG